MIQTIRPTPAMMMASLRRRIGQLMMVRIGPLDQSQRSLTEVDGVPLTYPANWSGVALVLLSDMDIPPQ